MLRCFLPMVRIEKMNQGFLKTPENIIAKQLIRNVALFAGIVAIVLTFIMGFISYSIETKEFSQQFDEIEQSYIDVIRTALWIDDKETINTVLVGVCSLPGIQYVSIHSKTDIVCESGKKDLSKKWLRIFPIIHVYKGKTFQLGHLYVQGDIDYLHKKIIKTVLIIAVAQAVTIFIICCLILWLLHNKVIARVLKITSYTSTLSLGTLTTPLVMPSKKEALDELDALTDGINQMRENLHQAYTREKAVKEELKQSHDFLEVKVEERTKELNETVNELQDALSEVKTLGGLLPICSFCKKIRDDKGYWNQIEAYIQSHSEAQFSHSICKECAKKHYPDIDIYDE